jgi:hypothetical protein
MANDKAVGLVDRIFGQYTDIPTSTIEFANAGSILDPATGLAVDVDATNYGRIRGSRTFQNPIIFDSDGGITGSGGVLGFFGFLQLDNDTNTLREGIVVLNGRAISTLGEVPFLGVFTHEFGHFAGPLDHAQVNGYIASNGRESILPPGFDVSQAFDLYAPFTETLYPFVFSAPMGSVFRNTGSFISSGFWIASLDMDTKNALSNLYPAPGYSATDPGSAGGAIEGQVIVRTASGDVPISGVNVIARRISQGSYPPSAGIEAFPGFPNTQIQLDPDGVPFLPPDRAETDSLATAASAVTGLEFGPGRYRIDGLPPGDYIIEVQQIHPSAVGGSSIGPLDLQLPIPFPEFYNGVRESGSVADSPTDFEPIVVHAGNIVSSIDIILNGISTEAAVVVAEVEKNDKKKKAQRLTFPVEVNGSAAFTDRGVLQIQFPSQPNDPVEDLYRFTNDAPRTFYILLEAVGGASPSDLDLYLFNSEFNKKRVSFGGLGMEAPSAGPTATEVIGIRLDPGTYYIGVSAFEGTSVNYKLRVLAAL